MAYDDLYDDLEDELLEEFHLEEKDGFADDEVVAGEFIHNEDDYEN